MTQHKTIALAGASGDLGFRIAHALVARGAAVRAIVRPDVTGKERAKLTGAGLTLVSANPSDRDAMAEACRGTSCVVSALNGLSEVIVDRQTMLLDAAVQAGVPRFIPSDFSLDFTKTEPGGNRNLDLRRTFMERADRADIRVTSVLNGAFMDMLGAEMPIVQAGLHRVLHWGDADQPLDFTTKDDVAAYVAAVALDIDTPRILRIAGSTLSPRELAATMTDVTKRQFKTLRLGGIGVLDVMVAAAKPFGPHDAVFPPFQGMQYMRDMMSGRGRLAPLEIDRYPELEWTSVSDLFARRS